MTLSRMSKPRFRIRKVSGQKHSSFRALAVEDVTQGFELKPFLTCMGPRYSHITLLLGVVLVVINVGQHTVKSVGHTVCQLNPEVYIYFYYAGVNSIIRCLS